MLGARSIKLRFKQVEVDSRFAGMTMSGTRTFKVVIPAKAGIHRSDSFSVGIVEKSKKVVEKKVRSSIIRYLWLATYNGVWSGNLFCEGGQGKNSLAVS
jgi:hypothetical protein